MPATSSKQTVSPETLVDHGSVLPATLLAGFGASSWLAPLWADTGLSSSLNAVLVLSVGAVVVYLGLTRTSTYPREVWLIYLLTVAAFPAGFWAAPTSYGSEKTLAAIILLPICLLGPMLAVRDERQARAFILTCAAVGIASIAATLPAVLGGTGGARVGVGGGDAVITAGRAAGFVLTAALTGLVVGARRLLSPWVAMGVALLPLSALILIRSGTRGPAVGSVVALTFCVLVVLLRSRNREGAFPVSSRGRAVLLVVLAVGGLALSLSLLAVAVPDRFTRAWALERDRHLLFQEALSLGVESPLGIGWGGFADSTSTVHSYPHNLLLELLVEGGWLPAGLLVLISAVAFARVATASSPWALVLGSLTIYGLVNALVSGDLIGNRIALLFIGVALASGSWSANQPSTDAGRSRDGTLAC